MKRCSGCQVDQPAKNFYRRSSSKDGLYAKCKACHIASTVAWQKKTGYHLVQRSRRYRMPIDDVERLMLVPACQCCGEPFGCEKDMCFDHCHEGGHVRGVICHPCNLACSGDALRAIVRVRDCYAYLLRDLERQVEQARAG